MINQNIWIAIAVGVFVAGIGIGYGIFSSSQIMPSQMMMGNSINNLMTNPQAMQQMMQDPNFRNEMLEVMIQDTDHMNEWMMEDPRHISLMIEEMKTNHDFMMGMAMPMIEDPSLRLQIMGHMTESPEAMSQMQAMMSSGMQRQGMMMDQEMMMQKMQDPETREKMIQIMTEHVNEMQEILNANLSDDEFNSKMMELMQKHQMEMQDLMMSIESTDEHVSEDMHESEDMHP